MSLSLSARVAELGLTLEAAAVPAANYVPFVQDGNLLFISGQTSRKNGQPAYVGRLGDNVTDEDGIAAARLAGLGILSQIAAATGDRLDRGASDLMVQVFGDAGRHARSAVGVASLPSGVAVEVEAVVSLTQS